MSQITSAIPASGPGSGSVTSISQGEGITLTPNPITATGTIALTVPVIIADGGTNATSFAITNGTVYFDGTRLVDTAVGTAGFVLTSNGAAAPTYQTVSASGAVSSVNAGANISITGTATAPIVNVSGTTNHALQIGNAGGSLTSLSVATNGQIPVGSTGADPVLATITAGANITVTNGAGTITIAANTGSETVQYVSVNHAASPYTALATDYYISADVTAGVISVLLPNAPTTGRIFIIKDKVGLAATSNITVTTVGGVVNIDGATTFVMNTAYESVEVIFNGTSYEIF